MSFLVFLSVGYFKSFNCRRELYAALASNRPFIPIFEADPAKGGASIEALKAECCEHCDEPAPSRLPLLLARVFEEAAPIVWVRGPTIFSWFRSRPSRCACCATLLTTRAARPSFKQA